MVPYPFSFGLVAYVCAIAHCTNLCGRLCRQRRRLQDYLYGQRLNLVTSSKNDSVTVAEVLPVCSNRDSEFTCIATSGRGRITRPRPESKSHEMSGLL